MEDAQKTLTIQAGEWCHKTASLIAQALQHATVDQVHQQVVNGAALFHIMHGDDMVGAFVLRIDGADEGVIVAATAKLDGVDMTHTVVPEMEKRFIGCKTVRYHTARPALAKKMTSLGYAPCEIVCVKKL